MPGGYMLREKQLVWQFNRGHLEAVREIYERHKHDLVTLATALLFDKSEAEDIVHDVFVGFIQSAGKFRLTGSLRGYLATCVANRARNRNRSKRNRDTDETNALETAAPDDDRPDMAAMFGEELQQVGSALAELPYEQREAVVLRLRGGMKFRAIAQVQSVSVNTVQGRFRYGLDRVKAFLNGRL